MQKVYKLVAVVYGIDIDVIFSKSRMARVIEARHIARYLCCVVLGETQTNVASFERVTLASVYHSVSLVRDWIDDPRLNEEAITHLNFLMWLYEREKSKNLNKF